MRDNHIVVAVKFSRLVALLPLVIAGGLAERAVQAGCFG
ncbi:hypothetical protein CFELI_13210 [Corynebacterium felinum]|uniref:Flagellar biosynthesis protein FlhB n=1 Tax=Corynebacterium felinum TaxID=131318 RepID=A0ABU2B5Z1_9CORY|nr:flagellar biosynthesis protein FlhB [Corynebacterium felinum]WJY96221.1 hypothetical protein CFELI_13210 [Corynebacterium felinum]